MSYHVEVIQEPGDTTDHIRGLQDHINSRVNAATNPKGWRDEIEQRFESLAIDYAQAQGGEVDIDQNEVGEAVLVFNFTAYRFNKLLTQLSHKDRKHE